MHQEQNLDFESIFNTMPGSFLVLKPNAPQYTILAISDELLHNTRMERVEVVGKGVFEVYPENPDAITATGPTSLRTSLKNAVENRVLDQIPVVRYDVPDGSGGFEVRYWSANSRPVTDSSGKLLYILHTTQDITDKIVAETRVSDLRSIEKKYSLFLKAPLAVCILTGPENIIELSNDDMLRFYNKSKDIIGQPLFEAIPEAKHQGFAEILDQVRKTGQTFAYSEYPTKRVIDGNEAIYYYNIVCQPYYENPFDKEPSGVFSIAHNVTELVLAKKRVEESEARLQAIIEATPECIKIVSPDGLLNYMNKSGLHMIEGDEELLGKVNVLDVIAPEHRTTWKKNHLRVCEGNNLSWEFDIIGLKGKRRRMETHAVPLPGENGRSQLAVTHDITKRKEAELALRESEEQFRTFANNIENLAWMADPQGSIYWYNERWFNYTGTSLEEMIGWGWEKVHHPDHVASVVAFVSQAWKSGDNWELTFPLRNAKGEYQWFLTRAYPVKDEQGNVLRWIGTNTNINEQKKAEASLEAKNMELVRINNDLDNFIYTASHDLKAPISNIEGLIGLLSEELAGLDSQHADIGHIISLMEKSMDRFKRTIASLTDLVKLQQESASPVTRLDLGELIGEVLLDLEPHIKASAAAIEVAVDACTYIYFSEKNLRSVVLNLLSNALKYAAADRVPVIRIGCEEQPNYHVLTVKDNGLGLSLQSQKQLFTMFKRFHDHVEGTGIGLYMVKKMVEGSGGYIAVSSEEGAGTEFRVFIKKTPVKD
ncbi:PAS domain-containing sensor histidine kinase [Pontibacter ramchanderi]|uniref:histidine kinase n=1 Tax=Pontibacter ramchanderi TaxID=1179743 RepID=A0A2N3V2P5_9BACT|nr:PAS domain S-box protein [Pontibacter ramchanderi]PKV75899.1 PAS domain S-box-containing protein [Pontibacter ramchanderi]